jgi:hypothetical protein
VRLCELPEWTRACLGLMPAGKFISSNTFHKMLASFSSWSWTSCRSDAMYVLQSTTWYLKYMASALEDRAARLLVECKDGSRKTFQELARLHRSLVPIIPEQSQFLHIIYALLSNCMAAAGGGEGSRFVAPGRGPG